MAKSPKYERLYAAFQQFLERCVLSDCSLLWPTEKVWTRENVAETKRRVVETPIWGREQSFEEKLQEQMKEASSQQWMILADVYYVYFLPSSFIKLDKVQNDIRWVSQQAGLTPPPANAEIWEAQKVGFTRTALKYHYKYAQFWLILLLVDRLKGLPDPMAAVHEPAAMQRILDELLESIPNKIDRAYDMRHAMLYMAFPDHYERIISTRDKKRIIDTYGQRLEGPIPADLDEAIRKIRVTLSAEHDQPDRPFDFYIDLKAEWRPKSEPLVDDEVKFTEIEPKLAPATSLAAPLDVDVAVVLSVLERTRNVILYGPPGTGKTYIAQKAAEALVKSSDTTVKSPNEFIMWTTFHQSYAYEDFVEGLRPVRSDERPGDISYDIIPGAFRRICTRAAADPTNKYVLVIDEINRGNIAKILGELITLLEDDKRSVLSVTLPYSGDTFTVPGNLYLIGTMNTADRSIALLDVALRRRFAFIEMRPRPELLDSAQVESQEAVVPLGNLLRNLNESIRRYLDRDHQIGHSYFLTVARASEEQRVDVLEFVWNNQITPLLEEYFYSQRDKLAELLAPLYPDPAVESDYGDGREIELERLMGDDLLVALARLAERGNK